MNINDKKTEILFNKKNHGSYGALLFDQRWKNFRKKILERDNNKCTVCNSTEYLQAHHKQYHFSEIRRTFKNPWDYSEKLLTTMCKSCHQKGHNKFKVPTKYIK
jgi:5-methylcytosine-specific restriction endonuclease McrA